MITKPEWGFLERGLKQRVTAINLFLKDVYGAQECIKAGIIPADLVYRNAHYRMEMRSFRVPHDLYVHIAGIDIVRTGENDFFVLEDNARIPSGVSYMLENREVMLRLFPDLFSKHRVAPVENYPDALLATLRSLAPGSTTRDPMVVLLTPGRFNSAFYEHSFLADKLGVELVEASDLFTKDDVVYMRTTEGPRRVDVIYRRLDDDFLDPLVFRPDSVLGVPGLMNAYERGSVTLANAVGTGISDDKAVYSYMPEIVKFFTGEEPILHNVPTYRCREKESFAYVMDNLSRTGGEGGQRLGRLRHAGRAACQQARARGFRQEAQARAGRLHRTADPVALHLPDLRGVRRRAAPRRSAAVRALRRRSDPHRAGRADPRGAEGGIPGGQFQSGRWYEGHLGARRLRS